MSSYEILYLLFWTLINFICIGTYFYQGFWLSEFSTKLYSTLNLYNCVLPHGTNCFSYDHCPSPETNGLMTNSIFIKAKVLNCLLVSPSLFSQFLLIFISHDDCLYLFIYLFSYLPVYLSVCQTSFCMHINKIYLIPPHAHP